MRRSTFIPLVAALLVAAPHALERKDVTFKIFQFPSNQIPRIDGKTGDWADGA